MKVSHFLVPAFSLALALMVPNESYAAHEMDAVNAQKRVLVTFKNTVNESSINRLSGTIEEEMNTMPIAIATVPADAIEKLESNPLVDTVTIDSKVHLANQTPDWGLTNINLPPSLPREFTGKNIKVAVLDTGIDKNHADLSIAGGDCFVSKYDTSWNIIGNGCPQGYDDDGWHGTHVAGIISAKNNGIGVVGVAPDASLYAVKVMDEKGSGWSSDVIQGIDWAIANKMDIINMSISFEQPDAALEAALKRAYSQGILIVGSSGNNAYENSVSYPAKYPTVIAVGATNRSNLVSGFSNKGLEIELTAPGENIFSTFKGNTYSHSSGTSMAAPYVSGLLALYKQAYPQATPIQIRQLIIAQAKDLGIKGKDSSYGYGLAQAPKYQAPSVPANFSFSSLTTKHITLQWKLDPQATQYTLKQDGKIVFEGYKSTYTVSSVTPGKPSTYTLTAKNHLGSSSEATLTLSTPVPLFATLTLIEKTPMYPLPKKQLAPTATLPVRTLKTIEKSGSWYKIITTQGPQWIDGTNAFTENVHSVLFDVQLSQKTILYTHPFQKYATATVLTPQKVKAVAQYKGWYKIETKFGKRWVNLSAYSLAGERSIQAYLHLKTNTILYSDRFDQFKTSQVLSPQKVKAIAEYKGWYKIETKYGLKWILPSNPLTLYVTPVKKSLALTQKKTLHTMPFFDQKTTILLSPRTVVATAKTGDWYRIQTQDGERWIYHRP